MGQPHSAGARLPQQREMFLSLVPHRFRLLHATTWDRHGADVSHLGGRYPRQLDFL